MGEDACKDDSLPDETRRAARHECYESPVTIIDVIVASLRGPA